MRRAAHTHTHTALGTLHPATRRPRRPTAPPRWERDEEMEQPEGEASNTYGRVSCAPRCSAFLTIRDSPALT